MKKHEAIKISYDNYPKGTVIKWIDGFPLTVDGTYKWVGKHKIHDGQGFCVYDSESNGSVWAKIVPAEVEEKKTFILKSEDGVDLYSGDEMWAVQLNKTSNKWELDLFLKKECFVLPDTSGVIEPDVDFPAITTPDTYKAFSTRESAEAWVNKMNMPLFTTVELFCGMEAHVYGGEIILIKDADKTVFSLYPSDIEDIAHVYTSKQQ